MLDIDAIIGYLRDVHPDISADQLSVAHSGADDDGLWFFRHPAMDTEVQLESSDGSCPFLVESSRTVDRLTASTIEQAIALVAAGLGLGGPPT